jgi:hypothetical protein
MKILLLLFFILTNLCYTQIIRTDIKGTPTLHRSSIPILIISHEDIRTAYWYNVGNYNIEPALIATYSSFPPIPADVTVTTAGTIFVTEARAYNLAGIQVGYCTTNLACNVLQDDIDNPNYNVNSNSIRFLGWPATIILSGGLPRQNVFFNWEPGQSLNIAYQTYKFTVTATLTVIYENLSVTRQLTTPMIISVP